MLSLIVGLFMLLFSLSICSAYYKAKAYNRITNSNVTTWEAMNIKLIIYSQPNRKPQ